MVYLTLYVSLILTWKVLNIFSGRIYIFFKFSQCKRLIKCTLESLEKKTKYDIYNTTCTVNQ